MIGPAILAAASIAAAPPPSVAFGFEAVSAKAGDRVTVHAQGFRSTRAVRLYLVRTSLRTKMRSALDTRLSYIATLRPRARHAMTTFTVPPLDTGTYVAWCHGCGKRVSGVLRVVLPAATANSCPVTVAQQTRPPGFDVDPQWQGNGTLWGSVWSRGIYTVEPQHVLPDGSIWTKVLWYALVDGDFSLSGRRLDAPGVLEVQRVNRGVSANYSHGPTWATPIRFAAPGCWRLTARVRDFNRRVGVSLSFVVKVEVR